MRLRNPKFKKSIRDDLLKRPQVNSEESIAKLDPEKNAIKVPPKNSIKKLWWSKYEPKLKNPKSK